MFYFRRPRPPHILNYDVPELRTFPNSPFKILGDKESNNLKRKLSLNKTKSSLGTILASFNRLGIFQNYKFKTSKVI